MIYLAPFIHLAGIAAGDDIQKQPFADVLQNKCS